MNKEPTRTDPNYEPLKEDFENNQSSQALSKDPMKIDLEGNNQPSKTEIKLISLDNDAPFNAKIIPKKCKNDFISKKRKNKKKSDGSKKNKKEKKILSGNSFKEGLKPILLSAKTIIEKKGNIKFPNFDCNYFIGGIKQNKILYKSKMYQIIGYNYEYKQILENARADNSEDEKILNYFLTSTFEDLFKEYFKNNRDFIIGGKKQTIGLFKIFKEVLEHKQKNEEKNIDGFIDASKKIFNNFEGCKEKPNRTLLSYYDRVKIERFDDLDKKEETIKRLDINENNNESLQIQKEGHIMPNNEEMKKNENINMDQLNNDSVSFHVPLNYEEIIERDHFNSFQNSHNNYIWENEEINGQEEESNSNQFRDDEINTLESTFDDDLEEEDSLSRLIRLIIILRRFLH